MRRPDREIKDRERILEILRTYDSIVLALNTGHRVFAEETRVACSIEYKCYSMTAKENKKPTPVS